MEAAKKVLFVMFLSALLLPLTSAGLSITQQTVDINKTFGVDVPLTLTLSNSESFAFYNITFEDNPHITMPLTNLAPGETKNITATIKSNSSSDITLRIKGFYTSQIGQSQKNHLVNVSFTSGLSQCSFSIIEGDSVTWQSRISDEIKAVNAQTGADAFILGPNANRTETFPQPSQFQYYFSRLGFQFAPLSGSCMITVLDDSGLVNDPNYDAALRLKVKMSYAPTQIQITMPVNSYRINFFETVTDQVITLKNIGNSTAQDIVLEGQWMTFSLTNFKLEPNETKGVLFSIRPIIYQTNQTNMTYNLPIKIKGNLPDVGMNISVFVNYAEIGNGSRGNLTSFMQYVCTIMPELCTPQVIYRAIPNGTDSVTFNVTEAQWRGIWNNYIELNNGVDTIGNSYKIISENISQMATDNREMMEKIIALEERDRIRGDSTRTVIATLALMSIITACSFLGYRLYMRKKAEASQLF